jgi:hypothetical protein
MRQRFTVIEGGAAALGTVSETVTEVSPHTWRIDLHKVAGVEAEDIAAWRALLIRTGVADPVHADPDYLLSAARHQAGGREIVFALAWVIGDGPERLGAVVPLALPHTLWGHGRIGIWQPQGVSVAPTIAADRGPAVQTALSERLHALRHGATLAFDLASEGAQPAVIPPACLRAVPRPASIPAHSLVGVRPVHAPAAAVIERISEPHRIRDAVEAFLLLDAEVSNAPIIADPSEAAMVRVVTRLFAERRQVTVTLTHRDGAVVAATLTLGVGAKAVDWRHVEGAAVPEQIRWSSLTPAGAESYASRAVGRTARQVPFGERTGSILDRR